MKCLSQKWWPQKVQRNSDKEKEGTHDRSSGVAGCEPAKLCAKLTFPPICLAAPGGTLPLPPMGMPPPNPHPAPFPTGPATPLLAITRVNPRAHSSSPIFPFGNLLDTVRPDCCCCCCWPPNPPGMPRSVCGTAPGKPRARQHISFMEVTLVLWCEATKERAQRQGVAAEMVRGRLLHVCTSRAPRR